MPHRHATLTDEEVVRRVQAGETDLFVHIYDRYKGRIARFMRHLGVAEGELEDLLAETFTRALARISSFKVDSGTRYVSYLYTVARNLVTDRLRERIRTPEMTPLETAWEEPDLKAESPVDRMMWRDDLRRIRSAMDRLSQSDREIIVLSYERELSCREIMAIMGKPSITSVTTHLYKAMKRLRELVHSSEPLAAR